MAPPGRRGKRGQSTIPLISLRLLWHNVALLEKVFLLESLTGDHLRWFSTFSVFEVMSLMLLLLGCVRGYWLAAVDRSEELRLTESVSICSE